MWAAFLFFFWESTNAKVNGPTRPINIVKIIAILPTLERLGVIPKERPTVPKADVTSKSTVSKSAFSVSESIDIIMKTRNAAEVVIAQAFAITSLGKVRPSKTT